MVEVAGWIALHAEPRHHALRPHVGRHDERDDLCKSEVASAPL